MRQRIGHARARNAGSLDEEASCSCVHRFEGTGSLVRRVPGCPRHDIRRNARNRACNHQGNVGSLVERGDHGRLIRCRQLHHRVANALFRLAAIRLMIVACAVMRAEFGRLRRRPTDAAMRDCRHVEGEAQKGKECNAEHHWIPNGGIRDDAAIVNPTRRRNSKESSRAAPSGIALCLPHLASIAFATAPRRALRSCHVAPSYRR